MSEPPAGHSRPAMVARIASRQGLVVAAAIALLTAFAWWWLWRMASQPMEAMPGMDMKGMDMGAMPDMPMTAPVAPWTFDYLASTALMWAIMMVAMMLPSAAPMILLHDVFSRRNGLGGAATLAFGLSYLALWIGFACLATVAQAALVSTGLLPAASLALGNHRLTGLLLIAAGLFELSPLKRSCLAWCQSPVAFLTRHWRPGVGGAVRMGLRHGLYCIGCCWLLMLLLFVGGVMNLAWVALLTLIVLAEKLTPPAWHADRVLGALLILGGLVALVR